jgi:hypothetical protein
LAPAEEVSRPPALQGTRRQERERRKLKENNEEEDASSDEDMKPGAVAVAAVVTGRTRPSALLSESQAPYAFDKQSLIVAELAEASQEEEELRRRNQELEQADEEHRRQNRELQMILNAAVQGTVIVENSGGGDHDQNPASSPFGRKGRRFWIGAALVLLLVVGVILGVVIPLTTNKDNNNNNKDSPAIDSVVTPTQSPTPPAAPTACTSRLDCLAKILLQDEVADADALQDESSPQFLALRGLANEDNALLDLDSTPTVIIVERYLLAVLYFATIAEGGSNLLKFLSVSSVCGLNEVSCNGDNLVVALDLGKLKHGEVIVLISKDRN